MNATFRRLATKKIIRPRNVLSAFAPTTLMPRSSGNSMLHNNPSSLSSSFSQQQRRTFLGGSGMGGGQGSGNGFGYRQSTPMNLGFVIVPQQTAYVVERLGKFSQILEPGLRFLIPFVDKVSYAHSLKEMAVPVAGQSAITKDNVTIQIDGVLY